MYKAETNTGSIIVKESIVKIDGSMGEGGGQVLRTSIALSLITGRPLEVTNIRAGRRKPGLMRQHLTALNAATEISGAQVQGASVGSTSIRFSPGSIKPGTYCFSVGTAGSATLVLQTVLPALVLASGPSHLTLEGGTHNPMAPPFDFLQKAFLPLLNRMGPKVDAVLEKAGYFPAGGGRFTVTIDPVERLFPIEVPERGKPLYHRARATVCQLSPRIGRRELDTVKNRLNWTDDCLELVELHRSNGPGNVLVIETGFEQVTEVFTGFGERGVTAENVAKRTANEARSYLVSDAPVGEHLADQLLLPMSLAGKGMFRTLRPTRHTMTNIEVIEKFLDVPIRCEEEKNKTWRITVG